MCNNSVHHDPHIFHPMGPSTLYQHLYGCSKPQPGKNTKNNIFITKALQGLTIEEKQHYFETFVISHLVSMSSIVTNLLMYGLLNKNFRNGLSSIRCRHNPGTALKKQQFKITDR